MNILIHTCCAPCLVGPNQLLVEKGHRVVALFFNPNVMPYREFRARLNAFKEYTTNQKIPALCDEQYALEFTLRRFLDRGEKPRCHVCYEMRLGETARVAAQKGFDAFTSTLCVSPYQEHEGIRKAGEAAAEQYHIKFLYMDWRPLFASAHEEAKSLGLYMQGYCGCIFSEEERYRPSLRKKMQNARRILVEGGS